MRRSESYNTKQKDLIFDIIKSQDCEFTVRDIYNKVKDKTGLTTVYRLVDKLVRDGLLNKEIGKDSTTFYRYLEKCDEENHFYLKCEKCGVMVHVDCDCINDLRSHILNNHKFKLSKEHIIINGICEKCTGKGG